MYAWPDRSGWSSQNISVILVYLENVVTMYARSFSTVCTFLMCVRYTFVESCIVDLPTHNCIGHGYSSTCSIKVVANTFKFKHVVVTTLYLRVNVRDKVEIRFYMGNVVAKDIYWKAGLEVIAMTLIAD